MSGLSTWLAAARLLARQAQRRIDRYLADTPKPPPAAYYYATCRDCTYTRIESEEKARNAWASVHVAEVGHSVMCGFQPK